MDSITNWAVFHPAAIVMVLAVLVAVFGTIAERRRARRRDMGKVGFMPWRDIIFGAMFVALASLLVMLKP